MVKFGYTILYVDDVARAIGFYEKAFGFERRFIAPGDEYGELETGGTALAFAAISLAKQNLTQGFTESSLEHKPFGIEIGLTTADVEAAYDRAIAAGATVVDTPKTKPWGQIVAYVRDPDGFLLEICTPMG